jgi:hypothetical protein
MIKTKRRKYRNKTKGKRRNYLKRQKGGVKIFGYNPFGSSKPVVPLNSEIEMTQLNQNYEPERPREKIGIEKLVGDRDKLQDSASNAYIASSATAVAAGIITGLAATGIGMPVAGLLAGALLIANKMLDLYKFNLLLRLLMQDAIFIIMDCYLLFILIEKSYQIIENFDDPVNDKCSNSGFSTELSKSIGSIDDGSGGINKQYQPKTASTTSVVDLSTGLARKIIKDKVRKYQINSIMQAQLQYQIEKLIKLLLSIMETKILDAIIEEPSLTGNAFGDLLRKEKDERTGSNWYDGKKFIRNYNRKFAGGYYITEINNILTIVNSYIILLKSNLDSVLKKFEILANTTYILIWKAILCTKEYNSYIKPNTQDVLKEAKEDARTVGVKDLIKSMELVTKVEELEKQDTVGGRRSRFVRKTVKRRVKRRRSVRKKV